MHIRTLPFTLVYSFVVFCTFFIHTEARIHGKFEQVPPELSGTTHSSPAGVPSSNKRAMNAADQVDKADADATSLKLPSAKALQFYAFVPENFYAADPWGFFTNWTLDNHQTYKQHIKTHPGEPMQLTEFFVKKELAYSGYKCGIEWEGCKFGPSLAHILHMNPGNPEKARQVYFTLVSFDMYFRLHWLIYRAADVAEREMRELCFDLANTFFHKKDKSLGGMCKAFKDIGIVILVSLALWAVAELGPAALSLALFGRGGHLMTDALQQSQALSQGTMVKTIGMGTPMRIAERSMVTKFFKRNLVHENATAPSIRRAERAIRFDQTARLGKIPAGIKSASWLTNAAVDANLFDATALELGRGHDGNYLVMSKVRFAGPGGFSMSADIQEPPQVREKRSSPAHADNHLIEEHKAMILEQVVKLKASMLIQTLRTLGFAGTPNGATRSANSGDDMVVKRSDSNPNMFEVPIHLGQVFRNKVEKDACGQWKYKNTIDQHTRSCKEANQKIVEGFRAHVRAYSARHNSYESLVRNRSWKKDRPAPLTRDFLGMFPSFPSLSRIEAFTENTSWLEQKLAQRLKASLISKAWADQQCYLQCGQGTPHGGTAYTTPDGYACVSNCWVSNDLANVPLYGQSGVSSSPWNLNRNAIEQTSYETYQHLNITLDALPLSLEIKPFDTSDDAVPILAVCQSDYASMTNLTSDFPCSCGDMFGSRTLAFWSALSWKNDNIGPKTSQSIRECRRILHPMLVNHPGAYLINHCRLFYENVYKNKQPQHRENNYRNRLMCRDVMERYEKSMHDPEDWLEYELLRDIWESRHGGANPHEHNNDQTFEQINGDIAQVVSGALDVLPPPPEVCRIRYGPDACKLDASGRHYKLTTMELAYHVTK